MLIHLNYWAILLAALVYWIVGAVWFSTFSKTWLKELESHGVKFKRPTKKRMIGRYIATFILNFLVVVGMAVVVVGYNITTVSTAIYFGLLVGITLAAIPLITAYLWESRSLKLTLIDIAYPIIGITLSSIILALWR